MSPVPFHRRVMLWVFILLFVVLAPAAVFYTAGYRWNPKKGVIERNGTLILDTTPPGATITLNGDIIEDQTPVTLQNVTPGIYRITLALNGYTTWEKTLDVRPERVTFVNDVRLWRTAEPILQREANIQEISAAPNGRALAWIERREGVPQIVVKELTDATGVFDTDVTSPLLTRNFSEGGPTGTIRLVWNQNSSAILLKDSQGTQWLIDRTGRMPTADRLPDAFYRWDNGTLIGTARGVRTEITVANGVTRQRNLPKGAVDEEDVFQLVATTGTSRLSVIERGRTERRFELPAGDWHFVTRSGDWLFLSDGSSWLGFDPESTKGGSVRLPAQEDPIFLKRGRETAVLAVGGGELWFDILNHSAELLQRLGEPLVGAAWHRGGNHVFYATQHDVVGLGLDPRDGRIQNTIAAFEEIRSIAMAGETLYVAGTTKGQSGLWKLVVE